MPNNKKRKNRRLTRLTDSLLGQPKDWLEITSFAMGDVHSEKTVHITKSASLAGDIYAARVVVAGLVQGLVAGREVIVEDGGQIWGDIYAVALNLAPRGKVHGWVTSLDEGTVDLLRSGELSVSEIPDLAREARPNDLENDLPDMLAQQLESHEDSAGRMAIWQALRAEAAAALLARAEIETMFDERVKEARNKKDAEAVREAHINLEEARAETVRLQGLLRQAATQFQQLRGRYLWTKANLDSAQAKLEQYQGLDADNERIVLEPDSNLPDFKDRDDEESRHEEMARLRVSLVEMEIELDQSKEQTRKLAFRLKKLRQMAERRFKNLNDELERTKRRLADDNE